MFTLLIGILIVAGSAAGFGFALFGRRPIPQPATLVPGAQFELAHAEPGPSSRALGTGDGDEPHGVAGLWDRGSVETVAPPVTGRRARDVTITPWVRMRATLLLALTVFGIAAIVGAVLSVIVVAAVFIAT